MSILSRRYEVYEKRLRWITSTSGNRHTSIFLNAWRCSLHLGQYHVSSCPSCSSFRKRLRHVLIVTSRSSPVSIAVNRR